MKCSRCKKPITPLKAKWFRGLVLCQECYKKKRIKIPEISEIQANKCCLCGNPSSLIFQSKFYCFSCRRNLK